MSDPKDIQKRWNETRCPDCGSNDFEATEDMEDYTQCYCPDCGNDFIFEHQESGEETDDDNQD